MKQIIALQGQTVWDIALQEMGAVEGALDITSINAFIRIDQELAPGQVVLVPDTILNKDVVDYFRRNNIHPASGLGESINLNEIDMINIPQILNYDLGDGDIAFPGVRLANMGDEMTVQINYTDLDGIVKAYPEQSLDGINFSPIMDGDEPLVAELNWVLGTFTFNINNLVTNFCRIRIEITDSANGVINIIIWRQ